MKVTLVSTFPPRRCGIGDFTAGYASELLRYSSGLQLRVLTYRDGVNESTMATGRMEIARELEPRISSKRMAELLRRSDPDIVHFQSSTFLHRPSVNAAIADACNFPLVTTVHDTPRSWRLFYTIPSLRRVYNKSRFLIAHSLEVSHALSVFHNIDSGRIVITPLGVDTSRFHPNANREGAVRLYGLEDRRTILYFGFLRPGKGIETLLKAWRGMKDGYPDATLVIAGGTPTAARQYGLMHDETEYPSRLRTLAQELGLETSVRFTGYVPAEVVPGLLAAASIIVLPYLGRISQSGPLHQAMSSGRPIVASQLQGFQSLIEDGKNGLLVPAADETALASAIRRLLDDRFFAETLGRNARELAERTLAWPIVVKRSAELYSAALDSREVT